MSEAAIAAGVRRIEALAGEALVDWATREAARQDERFAALKNKKTDLGPLRTFTRRPPAAMLESLDARAAELQQRETDLREWEKKLARNAGAELQKRAAALAQTLIEKNGAAQSIVSEIPGRGWRTAPGRRRRNEGAI